MTMDEFILKACIANADKCFVGCGTTLSYDGEMALEFVNGIESLAILLDDAEYFDDNQETEG